MVCAALGLSTVVLKAFTSVFASALAQDERWAFVVAEVAVRLQLRACAGASAIMSHVHVMSGCPVWA